MSDEWFRALALLYDHDGRMPEHEYRSRVSGEAIRDLTDLAYICLVIPNSGNDHFKLLALGKSAYSVEKQLREQLAAEQAEHEKEKAEVRREKKHDRFMSFLFFLLGFIVGMLTDTMKERIFSFVLSLFHL